MNKTICPQCWCDRSHSCDKCDNSGEIYDTQLSKNFRLSELTRSHTARGKSIPNSPTIRQVDRLRELTIKLLQPARDALGPITITSGFRSPELNSVLPGSAKNSAHMLAYAVDLQPEEVSLEHLMRWFFYNDHLDYDQVILEFGKREDSRRDDWVHVGYKNSAGQQRRQMLVMRNGIYTPWAG